MIPDAATVEMSGSVSNHCDRKSTALIVMSWTNVRCCSRDRSSKERSRPARGSHSRMSMRPTSGGTTDRIGLMNRAISAMSWPYSS